MKKKKSRFDNLSNVKKKNTKSFPFSNILSKKKKPKAAPTKDVIQEPTENRSIFNIGAKRPKRGLK